MLSFAARRYQAACVGGRLATQLCRNNFSEESIAKASRMARRQERLSNQKSTSVITPFRLGAVAVLGITGALSYEVSNNKDGTFGKLYYGSPIDSLVSWVYTNTWGRFKEIYLPAGDKILPDWPTAPIYEGVLPGTPAPPLLVLDLEKTLIGSEYDARYGWRHVKRPGLDQFLAKLSSYYEIVILSENDLGTVQELFESIDKEGRCHKFGNSVSELRDGVMLKRLDLMNRDLSKIILIDDNSEASKLFPENTLQIKPFSNVHDKDDTVLFDLVPLLQAFVHDGSVDYRRTIDDLGTNEAEEAVVEYKMRLSEKKSAEERKRNKGLGGVVRSRLAPSTADVPESRSGVLTLSQIVGEAPPEGASLADAAPVAGKPGSKEAPKPPAQKKKGALFDWLDNAEKEREEYEMRKREKLNEIYNNRLREKALKEQQEEEQKRRAADRL